MTIQHLIKTALLLCSIPLAAGFSTSTPRTPSIPSATTSSSALFDAPPINRRDLLQSSAAALLAASLPLTAPPAVADDSAVEVPLKTITDALFTISVPQRYFAIRRTVKGDLPDKNGQGRRGGTIFTAGDMSKAEVVAVERFPTKVLLEEQGITPTGDLSTFTSIGDSFTIANLLIRRREKDKPGTINTAVLDKNSISTSPDGMALTFSTRQQINVEKPELLMETMGVGELYRTTLAKAMLTSRDGNIMVVYASALDQDYEGVDGVGLRKAVDSFVAFDQSGVVAE